MPFVWSTAACRTEARNSKTDRQLLSPHAPEEAGAHDDTTTMMALDALGGRRGQVTTVLKRWT